MKSHSTPTVIGRTELLSIYLPQPWQQRQGHVIPAEPNTAPEKKQATSSRVAATQLKKILWHKQWFTRYQF